MCNDKGKSKMKENYLNICLFSCPNACTVRILLKDSSAILTKNMLTFLFGSSINSHIYTHEPTETQSENKMHNKAEVKVNNNTSISLLYYSYGTLSSFVYLKQEKELIINININF